MTDEEKVANQAEQQRKVDAAAKPKTPDPAAAKAEEDAKLREEDAKLEAAREGARVNNPAAPEAVAKQHEEVDAFNEKRNEENLEGHRLNQERIAQDAAEAQARTAHADDHRARHVPTGKENNRNTPRVLPDGTKVWDQ